MQVQRYCRNINMENKTFDIIVIGAGSGGLNIAVFANRIGLSTLLVDKSDKNIGGDCLNFGCVPSKALIHVARTAHAGRNLEKFGLKTTGTIDIHAVMAYVKSKQDIIREHENADWFRKSGISVALGEAKFIGQNKVVVGHTAYEGKRIVLATGSRPRTILLPGIEHVQIFNNESIFDINFLPKNLVIIGGGPIGIEIGQAFQRLGSQVSILERGEKFLPKEDKDITDILYKRLASEGLNVLFHAQAKNMRESGELVVEVLGREQLLPVDALFVGIGRQLNIEGLDLDKANIELEENGQKLKVDHYLRTTNKNVFVCGDVAGQYQFTHAAELHAGIIIRNWFSPFKKKLVNDNLSWVTYTDPEIATFGISTEELKKRCVLYETISENFTHDDRAITDDYRDGLLKLHISKKGKILGGTMIAPHAGELIQELILAQTHSMSLADIFTKIYPYPTAARINKHAAQNYQGRKLNEFSKKLLRMLFHLFG